VTEPAGLNLLAERAGRYATLRIPGRRIKRPCDVFAFVEAHDQTLGGIVVFSERPPALPIPRPADVTRAAAVTSFAAHADFGPGGGEAILGIFHHNFGPINKAYGHRRLNVLFTRAKWSDGLSLTHSGVRQSRWRKNRRCKSSAR
jgi:hypothetical protein